MCIPHKAQATTATTTTRSLVKIKPTPSEGTQLLLSTGGHQEELLSRVGGRSVAETRAGSAACETGSKKMAQLAGRLVLRVGEGGLLACLSSPAVVGRRQLAWPGRGSQAERETEKQTDRRTWPGRGSHTERETDRQKNMAR
ncbi:hypothetical protein ElyMa_002642600 [Elysia marginata]|uniref:Uncharacterized protein n=1 Tax=Elysia marginata TaxID=1093978 RepID=A0AAV4H7I5_9GAST|nr:hypothetical protein ElyMa_002642600 [Elysia marginata]